MAEPILYTKFAAPTRRRVHLGRWTWALSDGIGGRTLITGRAFTERGVDRQVERALSRCERVVGPIHPLSAVEAAAICDDLATAGIRVVIRLGKAVDVHPLRPTATLEEVQVLAAVLGRTDSPVRWHRFGAVAR